MQSGCSDVTATTCCLRFAVDFGGNSSQLIYGQASLHPDASNIPTYWKPYFFLNSWPKTGKHLKCNNFNPNVSARSSEGKNFAAEALP
jgi:hypothetical protein